MRKGARQPKSTSVPALTESATIVSVPDSARPNVTSSLVHASNARLPPTVFVRCDTFRAIIAGRNANARLDRAFRCVPNHRDLPGFAPTTCVPIGYLGRLESTPTLDRTASGLADRSALKRTVMTIGTLAPLHDKGLPHLQPPARRATRRERRKASRS